MGVGPMKSLIGVIVVCVSVAPLLLAQQAGVAAGAAARRGQPRPEPVRHVTPHLLLATFVTEEAVAPGQRFSIVVDITPKPGIHVYAPGDHDYRVITLRLEPHAMLRPSPLAYPKSQEYYFEPLDERVPVYEQPFRLTQEIGLAERGTRGQSSQTAARPISVKGVLEYQACTDTICYPPEEVPLTWVVPVTSERPRTK